MKIAIIALLCLIGCAQVKTKEVPRFSCEQLHDAHKDLLMSNLKSIDFRNKELRDPNIRRYSGAQIDRMAKGQLEDVKVTIKVANGMLDLSCTPSTARAYIVSDLIPGLLEMQETYERMIKHLKEI